MNSFTRSALDAERSPTRSPAQPIRDPSDRRVSYLRVSVTDRCNYLCSYCAPAEGWTASPRAELLLFEEIFEVIKVMTWRGVNRVRFTGGEPLLRRDLCELITRVNTLPEIKEIALTTNGHLLERMAHSLFEAGARRLNVSLDTFDPDDFRRVTKGGDLARVLCGIAEAQEVGFQDVVLNAVLTPELEQTPARWRQLCEESWQRGVTPRWIEMMPIGGQPAPPITVQQVLGALSEELELRAEGVSCQRSALQRGPARYYEVISGSFRGQRLGLISPMSDPHFCASCNRARLTARGGLRACLADDAEVDLKSPLRAGLNGPALSPFIDEAFSTKKPQHLMAQGAPPLSVMTGLGG